MSQAVEFYKQQIAQHAKDLAEVPWFNELKQRAQTDFFNLQFPTRHDEQWKYTPLDPFLQQHFSVDKLQDVRQGEDATTWFSAESLAMRRMCHHLCLHQGEAVQLKQFQSQLPEGVIVMPLMRALIEHPEKVQPYLGHTLTHEHGFHALNTAMMYHGLLIYIPAGMNVELPLWFTNFQSTANRATYLRYLVVVETGSTASVIEEYEGNLKIPYFTNAMTEVILAEGAKLIHYKFQREGHSAYHFSHLGVKQQRGSELTSHLFNLGGLWTRSDSTFYLHEPGAFCRLNGVYLATRGQHMDQQTVVCHDAPDCVSEQDYKGILGDHARAVFNGKVVVAKGAERTQARQQNKNILLGPQAEIDTKPQLNIYADDVVCSHGATVGQLDEDALFYLAARGLNDEDARQYLIQAFIALNVQQIPEQAFAAWLWTLLNQKTKGIR